MKAFYIQKLSSDVYPRDILHERNNKTVFRFLNLSNPLKTTR